ncbi:MAG: lipocalin family protein [Gammaproteobacteria bacterium]|jgi:apolipoprotein D and lipocalin family protein|nr:lipocalin family protein [Gammaproteobacteria bacterium]MCW8942433.1 lipocalin family protein [Gammaproteobacteria bacterium]
MIKTKISALSVLLLILTACTGKPDGVVAVKDFELDRYLGKWYEIARLDHSFERGLSNITAEYSLRDDGGVKVINSGFSKEDNEWQQAEGKAFFVDETDSGHLKVSFFGPFYGSYIVFELEKKDYQYAFVSGPDTSYLWLLARTPQVDEKVTQQFVKRSQELGFDTSKLIYVEHDRTDQP